MCRNEADERIEFGSTVFHCCRSDSWNFAVTDCWCDLGDSEDILTSNYDSEMTKHALVLIRELIVGLCHFVLF